MNKLSLPITWSLSINYAELFADDFYMKKNVLHNKLTYSITLRGRQSASK